MFFPILSEVGTLKKKISSGNKETRKKKKTDIEAVIVASCSFGNVAAGEVHPQPCIFSFGKEK